MVSAHIQDGNPRDVAWTLDMLGQAIRRDEKDNNITGGDPHEIWHRLSGRQMGYISHAVNDDVSYSQSVQNRVYSANADFDLAYEGITTFGQGSMGGMYVVQGGDTLSSIAASLWGDSSLWYKIADANGLTGDTALNEGQQLVIPVGVQRNENNSTTFKPYDPLEVLGNTSPTTPRPQKAKCGVMGAVLMAVVAIAVAAIVAPYAMAWIGNAMVAGSPFSVASGVLTVAGSSTTGVAALGATVGGTSVLSATAATTAAVGGGAIAGAASSIVSQGVALAAGIQDKFSW